MIFRALKKERAVKGADCTYIFCFPTMLIVGFFQKKLDLPASGLYPLRMLGGRV